MYVLIFYRETRLDITVPGAVYCAGIGAACPPSGRGGGALVDLVATRGLWAGPSPGVTESVGWKRPETEDPRASAGIHGRFILYRVFERPPPYAIL